MLTEDAALISLPYLQRIPHMSPVKESYGKLFKVLELGKVAVISKKLQIPLQCDPK